MSVHRVWNSVEAFGLFDCVCGERFAVGEDLDAHVNADRAELIEL